MAYINKPGYRILLLIIILIVFPVLSGFSSQLAAANPKAEKGIIDLTSLQFENDVVRLDGEWEFYWKQLLAPGEPGTGTVPDYIALPSSWNKKVADKTGDGYATYRLVFITKENQRLALKMPRVFTAYRLWVNGELVASAGTVGKTRDSMKPQYLPQVAFFDAQQGSNEIVIHVSNFHHRSGGILESLRLGSQKQIVELRYKNLARDFSLFGSLISIGIYHLAILFFRRRARTQLYFGLFCIMVGIRTLLVGECFFIYFFPWFNWEIAHTIQTLTYYLGVPLILMFFQSIYPNYFHRRVIRAAQLIGAVFGVLVIITPARIFTLVNPFYQIWSVIVIVSAFAVLVKIVVHKVKRGLLTLVGAAALLLTSLNDIVALSIWVNDHGPSTIKTLLSTVNLSSLGLFIFALINSVLLAKIFSDALQHKEIMTARLTEINTKLDDLVLQRTKGLEDSAKKIEHQMLELEIKNCELEQLTLIDPLTGLWNRRYYDYTIALEWDRCLRHQRPVALIIVDIDYYKKFNDTYGHMAGDECLIRIGETLKSSLPRSTDMVARYGGEEFVVLLTETTKEETISIAEKMRQKIEALKIPHSQSKVSRFVTVSMGGAFMIPDKDSSHSDLLKTADKALYQAKSAGRNQVRIL